MLQSIDDRAIVSSGIDLLLLARLVHAGLPVLERCDGPSEGFRAVAAEVLRVAETERRRIEREARRSRRVSATSVAPRSFPAPSSTPADAFVRTSEASATYGVSEQYLRRLAASKHLETVRGPRREYLFDTRSLAAWAASRATETEELAH